MAGINGEDTGPRVNAGAVGRSRSMRSHRAILSATAQLLAEVGYRRLTIEGVAARAGVGKATVYRWWASKGALVVDALSENRPAPPMHDTGSLRSDLVQAVQHAIGVLTSEPEGSIIPALTADLVRDPALAETFRTQLLRPRRAAVEHLVRHAVDRGELSTDVEVPLILDLCMGAVFYRLVLSGEPVGHGLAAQLVDLVLDGALPGRP